MFSKLEHVTESFGKGRTFNKYHALDKMEDEIKTQECDL